MQGSIFLEGPIPLFPSISALGELLLRFIRHVVYVAWTKLMIIYELVAQSSITILLGWLEVFPCVQSLEDCNHIVPNQRFICNEQVSEWSDSFRVSSKNHSPNENRSLSNHLLIMCELLAAITAVRGITYIKCSNKIIPQSVTEGLSIYSSKSPDVIFHRFQSLGPVLWIDGRYHFRVLVSFLHVPLVIHFTDLGDVNICMRACAPNHF